MRDGDSVEPAEGALYCRVAHRLSPQQVGVDQREALCRELANRHEIRIAARDVFIDPRSASWLRDQPRTAWDGLVRAVEAGRLTHVVVFAAQELQRFQPWDFAQLLALADRRDAVLLDPEGGWELNDRDTRRTLREETETLCRQRQAASRAARHAHEVAAGEGRPHGGGRRAYGYTHGSYDLVPQEAAVVREIFTLFLADVPMRSIAKHLNDRGVVTGYGGAWTPSKVARVLDAPRYAGLRVTRGEVVSADDGSYLRGDWEPCVTIAEWEAARTQRRLRAEQTNQERRLRRYYPLTGLVRCTRCERSMVGSTVASYPTYACAGTNQPAPNHCSRHISAVRLEQHVDETILGVLHRFDGPVTEPAPAAVLNPGAAKGRARSMQRLSDLVKSADDREVERAALVARIRADNRAISVRAADALDDVVTGKRASRAWQRMSRARRDDVRRFLIAQIRVGPVTGPRSVFDTNRVQIVAHPL